MAADPSRDCRTALPGYGLFLEYFQKTFRKVAQYWCNRKFIAVYSAFSRFCTVNADRRLFNRDRFGSRVVTAVGGVVSG